MKISLLEKHAHSGRKSLENVSFLTKSTRVNCGKKEVVSCRVWDALEFVYALPLQIIYLGREEQRTDRSERLQKASWQQQQ